MGMEPTVSVNMTEGTSAAVAAVDVADVVDVVVERVPSRRRMLLRATPFAMVILLLALWAVASRFSSPMAIPSPEAVWKELHLLLSVGYAGQTFGTDVVESITRIGIGFLAAVVIGVPVGVMMARSDFVFQAIDPLLQFIRPIPPLAYIPLLVVWFGIGESSKDILIALGTIPIIIINTVAGARATPVERIRVAACLGASRTVWSAGCANKI